MNSRILALPLAAAAALLVVAGEGAAQAPNPCAGQPHCVDVTPFTATVTDFRESTSGYYKVLSLTVRFRNKTDKPLALGYVQSSGLGTDDQGNRYTALDQNMRGIGAIAGNTFDAKFTLQPGEFSDARFELAFRPGNAILGTRYTVELAVREIDEVARNQYRLGREHALQFPGMGEAVAAAPTPDAPRAAPEGETRAPDAAPDPCAEKRFCHFGGPFLAEVTRVTESKAGYWQVMSFTVRFRNLTNQPLVLAYSHASAVALDDRGNRYIPSGQNHLRGMGVTTAGRADPSFALRPGEAREAIFQMAFRPGRTVLGTTYTFDFAVEQLEILPRNQIRTMREFAIGFRDLTVGLTPADAAKRVLDAIRGRRP